ncbi:MAG TPA: chromate transporter [Candidatus Binataceae bacterium]|nr:chromate transporter [Candidatus Binataceae bacterium]
MLIKLLNLFWVFALLSLLAVGGGTAVLPEMQYRVVNQFHWLTDPQFRDVYGLGQVAPGPNMLMVLVIGYRLAGVLGALVVGLAFFVPDCILTLYANRAWNHFKGSPWRTAAQRGLAPVAIGLMLAGTFAMAKLAITNYFNFAVGLVVFLLLSWRHVNPALLVLGGGVVYLLLRG